MFILADFSCIPWGVDSEMEFLNISLKKDFSLLLNAIHSPPILLAYFKENHTYLWF